MAATAAASCLKSNLLSSGFLLAKANRFTAAAVGYRRAAHSASAYEKNADDGIRPAAPVQDDVIGSAGSHKHYWAPNPATGVFGPAASASASPNLHNQQPASTTAAAAGSSVLDHPAWFRTVDDGAEH